MELLILLAIVFGGAVVWGVISGTRQRKRDAVALEEFNTAIQQQVSEMSNGDSNYILPMLPASEHRYRPVGKENLIAVEQQVERREYKSSGRYRAISSSVSIPIAKGVRYRLGSGQIAAQKSWQTTGTGRLLLTDKAIVFESPEKNERITWGQVADAEIFRDGYRIAKRSGPPRLFRVDEPSPKFAAALGLLLNRTT